MRSATVLLARLAQPICHHAWLAERVHQRLRGLLLRPRLLPGEGLLLPTVRSIHTIGMRYPLDLVCLSADLTVTSLQTQLPPNRFMFGPANTCTALELPPGTIGRTTLRLGDRLLLSY